MPGKEYFKRDEVGATYEERPLGDLWGTGRAASAGYGARSKGASKGSLHPSNFGKSLNVHFEDHGFKIGYGATGNTAAQNAIIGDLADDQDEVYARRDARGAPRSSFEKAKLQNTVPLSAVVGLFMLIGILILGSMYYATVHSKLVASYARLLAPQWFVPDRLTIPTEQEHRIQAGESVEAKIGAASTPALQPKERDIDDRDADDPDDDVQQRQIYQNAVRRIEAKQKRPRYTQASATEAGLVETDQLMSSRSNTTQERGWLRREDTSLTEVSVTHGKTEANAESERRSVALAHATVLCGTY